MAGEQLAHTAGIERRRLDTFEPVGEHGMALEARNLLDLQTGGGEHLLPFLLGVAAHVRRVAKALRCLHLLVLVDVVLDHDELLRHASHLADGLADVPKMVGGDPAGDDVEAAVLEGQLLRRSDDIRLHAGRRIDGHHGASFLAKTPRDVAASGGDVEHLHAGSGLAPFDDQVEVGPLAVRRALTERIRALRPDVGHAASSTARCAASSIVGSTCRFGGAASARILRPSSAFVPSRRTTIGSSILICSSAARIPRGTSSQRVMPPKMLKKIERTCLSLVITSSASTTPCASPPPPRSQKFAGLPPATTTTSTVDIERPAPLPRMPTFPSSLTYVTPFSLARRSCGSAASMSRMSAMSGWRNKALSSTVNLESSARTSP